MSPSLETLAEVLIWQGEHERAAHLFGAAEKLRDADVAPVIAFYRSDYDRAIAAATEALGTRAFESRWSEGRTLTVDEAVAYALGESSPFTSPS